MIDLEAATRWISWYVPDRDVKNPLVSPLYADLAGLPPLFVHVGGHESFLDDATRVAQRDEDGAVQVELKVWPEAFHAVHLFAGMIPEADQALAEAASWIAERLAGSAS
jgi:acetyl esterase/lipase